MRARCRSFLPYGIVLLHSGYGVAPIFGYLNSFIIGLNSASNLGSNLMALSRSSMASAYRGRGSLAKSL